MTKFQKPNFNEKQEISYRKPAYYGVRTIEHFIQEYMLKFGFLGIMLILTTFAKSQDTIFLKDGFAFECTVTRIDTANVYFDFKNDIGIIKTSLKKDDYQEIKLHASVAQTKKKFIWYPNYFSINLGLGVPSGIFASDDLADEKSGFAQKGLNLSAMYQYNFTRRFGLAVKGYYNSNRLETELLADLLHTRINLPVKINNVIYSSYGYLAGPTFNSKFEKYNFYAYYCFGKAYFIQPTLTYSIISGSTVSWVRFEEIGGKSYAHNFGAGIKFAIDNNIDIITSVEYLTASFDYPKSSVSNLYGQFGVVRAGTLIYKVYNFTIGLGFKF